MIQIEADLFYKTVSVCLILIGFVIGVVVGRNSK